MWDGKRWSLACLWRRQDTYQSALMVLTEISEQHLRVYGTLSELKLASWQVLSCRKEKSWRLLLRVRLMIIETYLISKMGGLRSPWFDYYRWAALFAGATVFWEKDNDVLRWHDSFHDLPSQPLEICMFHWSDASRTPIANIADQVWATTQVWLEWEIRVLVYVISWLNELYLIWKCYWLIRRWRPICKAEVLHGKTRDEKTIEPKMKTDILVSNDGLSRSGSRSKCDQGLSWMPIVWPSQLHQLRGSRVRQEISSLGAVPCR